jgi:3-dehydroquinate synthase
MTLQIDIPAASKSYPLLIQQGLLSAIASHLLDGAHKIVIITDSTVQKLYGNSLLDRLKASGKEAHLRSFPAGESSKTRATKEYLEDAMQEISCGRDTLVLALGGGVVLDIAAFTAATYCRGVPFIMLPTTLLAMVDACLGGKAGINTSHGKSLVGTFCHPEAILIDIDTLNTLPKEELSFGFSEVIKYSLIADRDLFFLLQESINMAEIIERCCRIKQSVVEADEKEAGLRRILNFGHTIAHALEAASGYTLPHGAAVMLGMACEAKMSCLLGYLAEEEFLAILHLLPSFSEMKLPKTIRQESLYYHLHRDKKSEKTLPRFVLISEIGKTLVFDGAYCTFVEEKIVNQALDWLYQCYAQ